MMVSGRRLGIVAALALTGFLLGSIWYWDSSEPTVDWSVSSGAVGSKTRINLMIQDEGRGLRSVELTLLQSGNRQNLVSEIYAPTWFWQQGEQQRSIGFSAETSVSEGALSEGELWLEVTARDQPNWWLSLWRLTPPGGRRYKRIAAADTRPPAYRSATSLQTGGSPRPRSNSASGGRPGR